MSHFVNAREHIVSEALDGFLWTSGNAALARLDGFPGTKVIVNRKHDSAKVAVISGGGSGHEPAHAGFVGNGMLAAAICGEIFASPSVDAILAGILAVTGKAGCLLVVKNYTGDRLNFGLAAEKARALGKDVAMVIVADDIAIDGLKHARGIAGTLFVHKVAGYHADIGSDLATVTAKAKSAAKSVITLGVSLSSCNVPGNTNEERIAAGKAEIGLGIHGEPGASLVSFKSARQIVEILSKKLFESVQDSPRYVVLLNNLGSTTPLEMSVVAQQLLSSDVKSRISHIVGPAPLVTSLDMHGFSVSMMPLTAALKKALEHPVEPAAWPGIKKIAKPKLLALPKALRSKPEAASKNANVEGLLVAACDALIAHEGRLNALDSKIGDGDTGTTVATAARALRADAGDLPMADLDRLFHAISNRLLGAMGGSSGVLLAIMFASAAAFLSEDRSWTKALLHGLEKVKEYGGAKLGDRTMIDALEPALHALAAGKNLKQAARVARQRADATAKMRTAAAGRASYVRADSLGGVVDPGADAVALLFDALAQYSQKKA